MSNLYNTLYDNNDNSHTNSSDIGMEIINQLHGHLDFETVSSYYDIMTYNKLFESQQTSVLNVMHINSRSLPRNFDSIKSLLKTLHTQPDVLVFTETWLTHNNRDHYELLGYHSYHLVRNTRRQGGVSVFVSNNFFSKDLKELTIINNDIEINTVSIKTNSVNFFLCSIYRPNSKHIAVEEFTDLLNRLLQDIAKNK